MLLQACSNIAETFRNFYAILQCFSVRSMQRFYNLSVLYGIIISAVDVITICGFYGNAATQKEFHIKNIYRVFLKLCRRF